MSKKRKVGKVYLTKNGLKIKIKDKKAKEILDDAYGQFIKLYVRK